MLGATYRSFQDVLIWARKAPNLFDAVAVHMGYLREDEAEEFVERKQAGEEEAWRVARELWALDPVRPRRNPV